MNKLTIVRKIQLLTIIAIVSSVSILVYVDSAYADEVVAVNDTISINDTVTVNVTKAVETVAVSDIEYELTGFKIHKSGIYDAEDDGNLVNKLMVGQSYWILFDFESELDTPKDIQDSWVLFDKSKITDNILKDSHGSMTIKPTGRIETGTPLTPEYAGHFKIIFAIKGSNDNTIGANVPQFDFTVFEKLSLKHQISDKTLIKDIKCQNDSHVLVERTNGKLACVFSDTFEKFDWKLV